MTAWTEERVGGRVKRLEGAKRGTCAACGVACNKYGTWCRPCFLATIRGTAEGFWNWVDRRGPDECWEWRGYRRKDGYGRGRLNAQNTPAHRIALELSLGRPIAHGLFALHHCDNPPCCNPAHLYEGTQAQNMADMKARGRWRGRRSVAVV